MCPRDCLVNLTFLRLLTGVLDQVGRLQKFREPGGPLWRKHRARPHVSQEFLRRLLGGADARCVFDILTDDAGEPQIELLDETATRQIFRQ